MSGQRESNPHSQLGKLMLGHSTMPALLILKSVIEKQMLSRSTNPACVGVGGFEPPTSSSQTRRATNCAIPRDIKVYQNSNLITVTGAGDRTRTCKPFRALPPQGSASSNFATPAWWAVQGSNL